jgi:hypothetical protein
MSEASEATQATATDEVSVADAAIEAPTCPTLPLIDDEALEAFLQAPERVGLLPVEPSGFRREFQRLIVSAYLHHSVQA